MAELTITALDAEGPIDPGAAGIMFLCDLNGEEISGQTEGGTIAFRTTFRFDEEGEATLDVIPNADIDQDNTYWCVKFGADSFIILKTALSQTLRDAEVADPGPLGEAAASASALAAEVAARQAHEADPTDAHDASAISFVPNGSIAAVNVQAAIQEVRDEAASGGVTSVNGETGAVTLSAGDIPSTPFGTIAATDVQAALEEVAAEATGGGPPTGAAGGVLGGTYPSPSFAADMATQAELDALTATDVDALPITGGTVTGSVTIDDGAGGASLTVMGGNGIALDAGITDQATYLFPGGMEFDNADLGFGLNAAAFFLDGNKRFRIDSDGALRWSTSTGVDDTALESNAGVLELDGDPVATATDIAGRQPIDSDLTAIAALSTTSYGRSLLALADAAAGRTALGLGTAATAASSSFQPVDTDLTNIAALATTTYGRALLTLADQAAIMALLSAASLTAQGIVELATTTEATTGTDAVRAVTAAGVKAVIDAHAAATDPHADRAYADTADLAVSAAFAALITAIETATKNWTGALTLNATAPAVTIGDGTAAHGTVTIEVDTAIAGRSQVILRDASGVARGSFGWAGGIGAAMALGGLTIATPDAAGSATGIVMPTNGVDISGSGGLRIPAASAATEALRRSDGDSRYNQNALTGPTGAVAESLPRSITVANLALLTTQILYVVGVQLRAGQTVSNIGWVSRTTALSGGNNQWACLLDSSRVVKAVSANGTSGAWAANTVKVFAMGTPFPIVTSGLYYLGLMVDATTVPTLAGLANATNLLTNIAPILGGTSSTGQTTPPSLAATMGAITAAGAGLPYAYAT